MVGGAGGLVGLAVGAAYHERVEVFARAAGVPGFSDGAGAHAIDARRADAVLGAAVAAANRCGGVALLSTAALREPRPAALVSCRVIQPLPVTLGGDDGATPEILFHTTERSRKYAELAADGRCALAYVDAARLACVVFTGTARRLPPPDADALYARWPLLPPLAVLYPTAAARADFTAWRLVPDRVQVVSIPDALGGGTRPDWRAPELERRADGGWEVVCAGGMQG